MSRFVWEPLATRQIRRFVVVGIGSVGIDTLTYFGLIIFGGPFIFKDLAKAISFVLGTILAFLANKFWTFESPRWSLFEALSFSSLYITTMAVNVAVNHVILQAFPKALAAAFVCATGSSTLLNFLGQKFIAFRYTQEHLRIFQQNSR